MSDNRFDAIPAANPAPSIDRARYWFEQYRYASRWEEDLIRDIRELVAARVHAKESV